MSDTLTKQRPKKTPGAGRVRRKGGLWFGKLSHAGVVSYCVHGLIGNPTARVFTPQKLIEVIQIGLPVRELSYLQASLAVPTERLAPMLGISKATFHRHKVAGARLGSAVSDRVVRFARLLGKAIKVFGDSEDARQWLNSPQFGLGNAVPLDYARTEVGAREVENLLGRIQYGVYS
jgi:putative toxin-antitoxin system antitoxin component (TIGR02293 family)